MKSIVESSQSLTVTIKKRSGQAITRKQFIVALAGNPNAGKTTLFNALTGMRQKVANFPGVTVERKEGIWKSTDQNARLIDLPGLYSLDATSLDEQIAHDVLTGKVPNLPKPNVVIAVVDATNLERNLYLVTQLLEYKIPIVVALTMVDTAERNSLAVDEKKLSELLRVPVVRVKAKSGRGIAELSKTVWRTAHNENVPHLPWLADSGYIESADDVHLSLSDDAAANKRIFARYNFISDVYQESVVHKNTEERNLSEKIDRVLTHKFFGLIILAAILLFVFQAIFSWANVPMDWLKEGFAALGDYVGEQLKSDDLLADLVTNGIIQGVGSVVVFLPQILLLFLFISILEDTGYMARAAFLLDKLMSKVGLHGKAFLPLMSSFACAIPGIMSTRTIENPKDRLATILIAPFMSCSARLPVYALMIGTFFAEQKIFGYFSVGAVLMLAMYALGIVVAVIVAWILKRTILKSPPPPFVMELPPYRLPNPRNVLQNMFNNGWIFLKRAGTIILAISIILWALAAFPRTAKISSAETVAEANNIQSAQVGAENSAAESVAEDAQGEQIRHSYAGKIGHLIEPVIKPLGFDWKIGIALVSSFAARETLVSTLGIIYNVGKDADEENADLKTQILNAKRDDGTPVWTPLTALTLMVFFVLALQCMSTVAVVKRETNSWAWALFMVFYMTGLAYVAAFLTYQGGKLLGFG